MRVHLWVLAVVAVLTIAGLWLWQRWGSLVWLDAAIAYCL